jgi:hypothetical protein
MRGGERVPQVRIVLGDGVHQGIHNSVENGHREWVTLVDTLEEGYGGSGPSPGGENGQEASVEVAL